MNRKLAFTVALLAWLVASSLFAAEPVMALLEKARGNVTEFAPGGGLALPLKTGDSVPAGRGVSVGRLSVAVYRIGQQFMLKQDPHTSLQFTGMTHVKGTEDDPDWQVGIRLQSGDLYSALQHFNGETSDYRITTSRIEAIAHSAVFKVSHAFSTSMVFVKQGVVEVLYCNYTKRVMVHAGEVFVVTDCDGVLRWQTDEESRGLTLFAALTDAGFGNVLMAMLDLNPAGVLAPQVPVSLPIVSP